MNIYEFQQNIYNSINDFGPNRRSLEKSILLHELTLSACYEIQAILNKCNYKPNLRDVDRIETIASRYREISEVSQRQILALR